MLRLSRTSVAAVLFALSTIAAANGADSDRIDLDELARRQAKWRASFVSLHVLYDVRGLPAVEEPTDHWSFPPPDPESAPLWNRVEWFRSDDGLELFDDRCFYWNPGSTGVRDLDVFNGPEGRRFRASYRRPPNVEQEKLIEFWLLEPGNGPPTPFTPRPMEGVYWSGESAWLSDVLVKGKWKLEGIEDVVGAPCARISAGGATLWLDLDHDCLVRRYQRTSNRTDFVAWDFIVDDFQQLPNGIWFPSRGRNRFGDQHHLFVVTKAEVNPSLDPARFEPPALEDETRVIDQRRPVREIGREPATLDINSPWVRTLGWVSLAFLVLVFGAGRFRPRRG